MQHVYSGAVSCIMKCKYGRCSSRRLSCTLRCRLYICLYAQHNIAQASNGQVPQSPVFCTFDRCTALQSPAFGAVDRRVRAVARCVAPKYPASGAVLRRLRAVDPSLDGADVPRKRRAVVRRSSAVDRWTAPYSLHNGDVERRKRAVCTIVYTRATTKRRPAALRRSVAMVFFGVFAVPGAQQLRRGSFLPFRFVLVPQLRRRVLPAHLALLGQPGVRRPAGSVSPRRVAVRAAGWFLEHPGE